MVSVVNEPLNFMIKMAYFVMDLTTIKEKLKYLMKKNPQLWILALQRLQITSEESLQLFCLWLKCGGKCLL